MRNLYFFICILLSMCVLLSCAKSEPPSEYENGVAELEMGLEQFKKEQAKAAEDSKKAISDLSALVNSLIKEHQSDSPSNPSSPSQGEQSTPSPAGGFSYTLSDGYATVTGYLGSDTQLVIPASIDGNRVVAIADSAFDGKSITSVIISDGIERIGWFAFNNCPRLSSVTVPSSVTDIGYLAFGSAGASLTVYCHASSFALSYAKSYGLTYTII